MFNWFINIFSPIISKVASKPQNLQLSAAKKENPHEDFESGATLFRVLEAAKKNLEKKRENKILSPEELDAIGLSQQDEVADAQYWIDQLYKNISPTGREVFLRQFKNNPNLQKLLEKDETQLGGLALLTLIYQFLSNFNFESGLSDTFKKLSNGWLETVVTNTRDESLISKLSTDEGKQELRERIENPDYTSRQDKALKSAADKYQESQRNKIIEKMTDAIVSSFRSWLNSESASLFLSNEVKNKYTSENNPVDSLDEPLDETGDGDDEERTKSDTVSDPNSPNPEDVIDTGLVPVEETKAQERVRKQQLKTALQNKDLAVYLAAREWDKRFGKKGASIKGVVSSSLYDSVNRLGQKLGYETGDEKKQEEFMRYFSIPSDPTLTAMLKNKFKTTEVVNPVKYIIPSKDKVTLSELESIGRGLRLCKQFIPYLFSDEDANTDTIPAKLADADLYNKSLVKFLDDRYKDDKKGRLLAESVMQKPFVEAVVKRALETVKNSRSRGANDAKSFVSGTKKTQDRLISIVREQLTNLKNVVEGTTSVSAMDYLNNCQRNSLHRLEVLAKEHPAMAGQIPTLRELIMTEYQMKNRLIGSELRNINRKKYDEGDSETKRNQYVADARNDIASAVENRYNYLVMSLSMAVPTIISQDGELLKLDFSDIVENTLRNKNVIVALSKLAQSSSATKSVNFDSAANTVNSATTKAYNEALKFVADQGGLVKDFKLQLDSAFLKGSGSHLSDSIVTDPRVVAEVLSDVYTRIVPQLSNNLSTSNYTNKYIEEGLKPELEAQAAEVREALAELQPIRSAMVEDLKNMRNEYKKLRTGESSLLPENYAELSEIDQAEARDKALSTLKEKINEDKSRLSIVSGRCRENRNSAFRIDRNVKQLSDFAENNSGLFPDMDENTDVQQPQSDGNIYKLFGTNQNVVLDKKTNRYYEVLPGLPGENQLESPFVVPEPAVCDPQVAYTETPYQSFVFDPHRKVYFKLFVNTLDASLSSDSVSAEPLKNVSGAKVLGDLNAYDIAEWNTKLNELAKKFSKPTDSSYASVHKEVTDKEKELQSVEDKHITEIAGKLLAAYQRKDPSFNPFDMEKLDTVLNGVKEIPNTADSLAEESVNLRNVLSKMRKYSDFFENEISEKTQDEYGITSLKSLKPHIINDIVSEAEQKLGFLIQFYFEHLPKDVLKAHNIEAVYTPVVSLSSDDYKELYAAYNEWKTQVEGTRYVPEDTDDNDFSLDFWNEEAPKQPKQKAKPVQPAPEPDKPAEPEQHSAGFAFTGFKKEAAFFHFAKKAKPFFHMTKIADMETNPTEQQLMKDIENPLAGGTEAEPEIAQHNQNNQTMMEGQTTIQEDKDAAKSFSTKKVAQGLKMAYEQDHALFNELVQLVRDSNPTTGDETAQVLENLPKANWTMEAAMRITNPDRDRNYYQTSLKNDGWPAMIKNDAFIQILNKFNNGEAK